jgi:hypothetical protein
MGDVLRPVAESMGLADIIERDLDPFTTNDIEDYVPSPYVRGNERGDLFRGHNESLLYVVRDEDVNGTLANKQPVVETVMELLKRLHEHLTDLVYLLVFARCARLVANSECMVRRRFASEKCR